MLFLLLISLLFLLLVYKFNVGGLVVTDFSCCMVAVEARARLFLPSKNQGIYEYLDSTIYLAEP